MNKNSYILIACEESGLVTHEFIELGYKNVFSCDLQETSGLHPDRHVVGDVLQMLNGFCEVTTQDGKKHVIDNKFTMLIAFPPCTYLSNAGATRLFPNKILNEERYQKGLQGKEFFMQFYNADIKHICVENPVPTGIYKMPKYSQIIQPYEHGHNYQKATCLWIKNLPLLKPTNIVEKGISWVSGGSKCRKTGKQRANKGGKHRDSKTRSKTFPGIAKSMAQQWSSPFKYEKQLSLLDYENE